MIDIERDEVGIAWCLEKLREADELYPPNHNDTFQTNKVRSLIQSVIRLLSIADKHEHLAVGHCPQGHAYAKVDKSDGCPKCLLEVVERGREEISRQAMLVRNLYKKIDVLLAKETT
jgi:hypothetical protein